MESTDQATEAAADDTILRIEGMVEQLNRYALESPETWSEADLTIGQLKALFVLRRRGPLSVGALSAALSCSVGSGSAMSDRLVRMGLVRRLEDPDDRRIVLLDLDAGGRTILDDLVARRRAHLRASLQRLSPTYRRAVAQAMRTLIETMRNVADPEPGAG